MKIKDNQRKNFSVTVPAGLGLLIKARAASQELTVSRYVCRLIKSDINAQASTGIDDIIK